MEGKNTRDILHDGFYEVFMSWRNQGFNFDEILALFLGMLSDSNNAKLYPLYELWADEILEKEEAWESE